MSFSNLLHIFLCLTGTQTVTQHLNIIMCIKLHLNYLSLNALRKSPINWFIQSICRICISCIFSMLDATRSPWDLISSKAHLKCSSPSPSSASFTLRFLLPWPFFLSKRDFCGAAVSFGLSASSLLDSADRFKEAVNPKFRKKVDNPSNFKRCLQRKSIMSVF